MKELVLFSAETAALNTTDPFRVLLWGRGKERALPFLLLLLLVGQRLMEGRELSEVGSSSPISRKSTDFEVFRH